MVMIASGCATGSPTPSPIVTASTVPTTRAEPTPAATSTASPAASPTASPATSSSPRPAPTASLPPGNLIATVTTDHGPCAIAAFDDSVWVTNLSANNVSRIDGATNEVGDTVDVGRGPCAIASDGEALWIGILSELALVRFDPQTKQVTDRFEVGGPVWDIQVGHGAVWVSVQQAKTLLRIDPDTRQVEKTFDAGAQPSGVAITSNEVWLATSVGTIMRVDPETNERLPDITVEGDPSWFASGPDSVVLTLSNAERVAVVETNSATVTTEFELRQHPRDPGFVGDNFWVTANGPDRVVIVSPISGAVIGGFAVPSAGAIWTAEGLLGDGWVLDFGGRDVFRYEADSGL